MTSPLPITGSRRGSAARTSAIGSMRAAPEKPWARVRPCTVIIAAPASTRARAKTAALRLHSSQPARCLTVTGMRAGTARRTAATSSAASAGSRISAEPQAPAVTFFAGQPMLMSTMLAPMSAAIPAARASTVGSRPKIWTANVRPSKLGHIRSSALVAPRVSASADRNSVKLSEAPSSSQTVRKGRSVTASIGARRAPGLSWTSPMRMRGRENSTNVGFLVASVVATAFALTPAVGCKRRAETPAPAVPVVPAVSTATRSASSAALLVDVVDPWSWPRAQMPARLSSLQQQRLDRAKTLEDIGPYERQRPGDRTSPLDQPERPLLDGAGGDRLGP